MTKLLNVAIDKIVDNCEMLRGVDRQNSKFVKLVGSVKSDGVMTPITVIVNTDDPSGETYILVDGKQRLTAARDCNYETIPVHVLNVEQRNVLLTQVIANSQSVETRPVEYSRALLKIIAANPTMTRTELAAKLNHDTQWLDQRLGLLDLVDEAATLVDAGKISLSNAYALAKLASEDQPNFIEQAMTVQAAAFSVAVASHIRSVARAKRAGRPTGPKAFEPVEYIKPKRDIVAGPEDITKIFADNGITPETPQVDIFKLALKWVLSVDAAGVAEQKAKADQRAAENKLKQEAAKAERLEIARRIREEMEARRRDAEAAAAQSA